MEHHSQHLALVSTEWRVVGIHIYTCCSYSCIHIVVYIGAQTDSLHAHTRRITLLILQFNIHTVLVKETIKMRTINPFHTV